MFYYITVLLMKRNHLRKGWSLTRFSPFFLCTGFLVFYFLNKIFSAKGTIGNYVLLSMLIANIVYTDIVLWNYFERQKGIIWIIESIASALLIYCLI